MVDDFWSISGNFIFGRHVAPRVKLYVPREASFPIPLNIFDVTRTIDTSLGAMLEKKSMTIGTLMEIENCQIRGQVSQDSPCGTKKPPDGYTLSGERLTRKQTNSRPDNVWPEIWKDMSDASKCKEKHKWAIEKPKLDNARKLRGVYFIDPVDEEFKDIVKNARRKLEVPMPAAIPCKLQRDKYRETCRTGEEHKTKYACIVEADESMRKRMEGCLHKSHEDHIAGKGMSSLSHCNLVHKFIPVPQAMKISGAKAAMEK